MASPLDYALRYAGLGWPVFPIHDMASGRCSCGNPACSSPGKHPRIQNGFHSATTNPDHVKQWWGTLPKSNVGTPTGLIGWVLDVDPRNGGDVSLDALLAKHGPLPDTLVSRTPSGGTHYWFAPDQRAKNTAGKVGPGLDTRGEGGYVLVEGSALSGGTYQFLDWSPLDDGLPPLAAAPAWLIDAAFGRPAPAKPNGNGGTHISEGGRNAALASLAGSMRRRGMSPAAIEAGLLAENTLRCDPPLPDDEVRAIAASVGRYAPAEDMVVQELPSDLPPIPPLEAYENEPAPFQSEHVTEGAKALSGRARPTPIDWAELRGDPPPRDWVIEHWVGAGHPMLFAGPGSIGKSLMAQQLATDLAAGRDTCGFGAVARPYRVGLWACEDDRDELWRRQAAINTWTGLAMSDLSELFIFPRFGCENSLLVSEYGRPMWTAAAGELGEVAGDMALDVLFLDNIGQLFGANENSRHDVTFFLNGLSGWLRLGQPGGLKALILLAHPSKAAGSEFSGSTAWENAVRMRWWMNHKLPDEQNGTAGGDDDLEADDTVRYICKRKTNYSSKDYRKFSFQNGVLVPMDAPVAAGDGLMASIERDKARRAVVESINILASKGIFCSDAIGPNYLPSKMLAFSLLNGCSKSTAARAMNDLIIEGVIAKEIVGKLANRMPRTGFVVKRPA